MTLVAALFATGARAGVVESGYYKVHYNAINSMQLPDRVAARSDIERDGDRAVVTITLQRPTEDDPYRNVPARVTGNARTLLGVPQTLEFQRVSSGDSVFSIAVLPLRDAEQTVTVTLEVTTLDGSALIPVRFTKRLYAR